MASMNELSKKLADTNVNSKVSELSFKGRGLKLNKAEDAQEIIDAIEKFDNMQALCMEGNTLGVEAAEAISKALGQHPEFERALWSDMFTGRLKTEIPQALKHLGAAMIGAGVHLVELDLSDNAFGPNGVVGLVDLLKSDTCFSLEELKLNNNGLGIGGGKMLAECLLECHQKSVQANRPLALRVFISGRNRLENDGATALAKAFKAIGTLEFLAMPQNGINHPGISALADAISCNPQLRHLNLNDNTFTAKGAHAIAKALPKLSNLEVINFGDCLVRTEGAQAIAAVLRDGPKNLQELILSGNEIKKEGAIEIVESLENRQNLTKLDLDANMLGEEGSEDIKTMMEDLGLQDALATLSGDEGSEDEDEDEDGYEDEEEEEEEPEEDTEGDISTDPKLQVKGSSLTPSKQAISAKDFLSFPSPSKLVQLGNRGGDALLHELGSDKQNVERIVDMLMKVSMVVSKDDEAKSNACSCADTLLSQVLTGTDNAAIQFVNAVLVAMGILKGEDKKRKPPSSITGPLLVLEHVVKQSYFPSFGRNILSLFLSKPHQMLEKSSEAQHRMLQTLHGF